MEIKSEPQYDTINVTDIDIAFPGDLQTFCLWEGKDSYERDDCDLLTIHIAGGTVEFHLQHAHWIAIRKRTMRVVKPEAPKVVAP